MKQKIKSIGLVLLFFVGLSILLYPTVSNTWNEYRAKLLISTYSGTVTEDSDPVEYARQLQEAQKYNEELTHEAVPDAFSIRDGLQDDAYDAVLDMNDDGLMGSVEIPVIDVNLPLYHYTTDKVLEKGVGHLFGSSLPVGGESTHAVVSAHRGLPSSELFTNLNLVEEGDIFYFHILGNTLAYEVDQILIVEPEEVEALAITEGEDLATLVTCTPYGVNSHRLLVRGHRIPFVEEEYVQEKQKPAKRDHNRLMMQGVCVLIGLLLSVVVVWTIVIVDRKKRLRTSANTQKRNGRRRARKEN